MADARSHQERMSTSLRLLEPLACRPLCGRWSTISTFRTSLPLQHKTNLRTGHSILLGILETLAAKATTVRALPSPRQSASPLLALAVCIGDTLCFSSPSCAGLIIVGDAALENCNQSAACCDMGTRYKEPLNPRLGSGPTFNASSCDTICSGMGMVRMTE